MSCGSSKYNPVNWPIRRQKRQVICNKFTCLRLVNIILPESTLEFRRSSDMFLIGLYLVAALVMTPHSLSYVSALSHSLSYVVGWWLCSAMKYKFDSIIILSDLNDFYWWTFTIPIHWKRGLHVPHPIHTLSLRAFNVKRAHCLIDKSKFEKSVIMTTWWSSWFSTKTKKL